MQYNLPPSTHTLTHSPLTPYTLTHTHTQLVDTTVEIANKVGAAEIASRVVEDLKDESEQYRKMVMDCLEKVCLECVVMVTCCVNCLAGPHIANIAES